MDRTPILLRLFAKPFIYLLSKTGIKNVPGFTLTLEEYSIRNSFIYVSSVVLVLVLGIVCAFLVIGNYELVASAPGSVTFVVFVIFLILLASIRWLLRKIFSLKTYQFESITNRFIEINDENNTFLLNDIKHINVGRYSFKLELADKRTFVFAIHQIDSLKELLKENSFKVVYSFYSGYNFNKRFSKYYGLIALMSFPFVLSLRLFLSGQNIKDSVIYLLIIFMAIIFIPVATNYYSKQVKYQVPVYESYKQNGVNALSFFLGFVVSFMLSFFILVVHFTN